MLRNSIVIMEFLFRGTNYKILNIILSFIPNRSLGFLGTVWQ